MENIEFENMLDEGRIENQPIWDVRCWLQGLNEGEYLKVIKDGRAYTNADDLFDEIVIHGNYERCIEDGNVLTVVYKNGDVITLEGVCKGLLEQVKQDHKKIEESFEYDLLYRIIDSVPKMFRDKLRYDDKSYTLYIGETEIGVLGDIGNVVEVDNHIGYYQLRNICELDFVKYNDMEEKTHTRRLIFDSKEGKDFYELKEWIGCEMESPIVEDVLDDLNRYQYRFTDNDYSSIYMLVENLDEWNSYDTNIEYIIDIKDEGSEEYCLYLENTKICSMEDLTCCHVEENYIKYQLKEDKFLYIVIKVQDGNAFINQIYIENEELDDEDDGYCEMIYEKEI